MLYTIARKFIGYPGPESLLANGPEGDAFIFETKEEAKECLKSIFKNGEVFYDERFGRLRHYVTEYHE